jgi:CheY-like chemotaxis protein
MDRVRRQRGCASIAVILVSGSAQDEVSHQAIAAGAIGVLSKPVELARLRAMVDGILRLVGGTEPSDDVMRRVSNDR